MSNWAMITGAGRRIGRAIALDLAAHGWDIIIHYHKSAEAAQNLAKAIDKLEGFACLVEMDLANQAAAAKLIPSLVEELGPIGALINNASLFEPDDLDTDGARHHALNVEAPRLLSEAFFAARDVDAETPPVIVNLLDADPNMPNFAGYGRSKQALATLTAEMALRFAPHLRVNGVALGPILPGERETLEHHKELIAATPLQQPIALTDIAAVVRLLVETPSITGAIVPVDGGAHLRRTAAA